jgi:phosphatidylserine/phosphatidylglycerophosphate/cardiolipin synthase-like enzyme
MIIDGETAITGSFNFTWAAEEKDAGNLLITRDHLLALKYTKNRQEHVKYLDVYTGRGR